MALAEWLTKSGVQGTKEADFFLQCLASVFADCLAKDTKGNYGCDNLYSNSRLEEAGFQLTWERAGSSRGCVESKYSARF